VHNAGLLLGVPRFAFVARLIDPTGLGEIKVLDQPPGAGLYHLDGNRHLAPIVLQLRRYAADPRLARRNVAERAGLNAMQEELHDHDALFVILGMDLRRRPPVGAPELGHSREVAVCHGAHKLLHRCGRALRGSRRLGGDRGRSAEHQDQCDSTLRECQHETSSWQGVKRET
jgi:hypothetical protein